MRCSPAKPGDLLAPVQSDFGWHVIKVTGVRPARTQPFDEVRAQIEGELKKQKAAQKFATAADQFQNLVYEQADSLERRRARRSTSRSRRRRSSRARRRRRSGSAIPSSCEALFSPESIQSKRNTEAIEVAPSSLIAGRIVEYKPAAPRPFADVKDEIRQQLDAQGRGRARAEGRAARSCSSWKRARATRKPASRSASR